jgi:hypothetical protein
VAARGGLPHARRPGLLDLGIASGWAGVTGGGRSGWFAMVAGGDRDPRRGRDHQGRGKSLEEVVGDGADHKQHDRDRKVDPAARGSEPAYWTLAVLGFTRFFFGVLGVLVISGEHSGGTIRSSLGQPGVARAAVAMGSFSRCPACSESAAAPSSAAARAALPLMWRRPSSAFFVLGFSPGHAGWYTPEIMLLISVSAVRSNAAGGFLPPPGWEGVALMACYSAVAFLAGAILFARRDR